MERHPCHCVFPSPSEECLATFEGRDAGTAIRVMVEPGADGYVRLQQMAYTDGMGWYVQKTMVVPGEMLKALATELRKADCLIPKTQTATDAAGPLRLVPVTEASPDDVAELRRA